MEQRDYLKEQIEQAGRAMGKLLGDFLALDRKGDVTLTIQQINQQLKTAVDLDVETLPSLEATGIREQLRARRFDEDQLTLLARYLYELSLQPALPEQDVARYRNTALLVLDLADESETFSFPRMDLRAKLKKP